jgi:LuxR family maltose regulon positive regulatory protein
MWAKVCLEKGDVQAVVAWIESLSQIPNSTTTFLWEEAYMVQAKLYQRDGKHAEAHALLDKLAGDAEAGERNGSLIPILILQSISLDAQGLKELALDRLEKSLHLAQRERYLMTFLDEGLQVGQLLRALVARGLSPVLCAYAGEISQAFTLNAPVNI